MNPETIIESIRSNMKIYGLEDMAVTINIYRREWPNKNRDLLGVYRGQLSEACALKYHGVAEKMGIAEKDVEFQLSVQADSGRKLGIISSNGVFYYQEAPDLRTALAWAVATDGGRSFLTKFFEIDQVVEGAKETVATYGTSKSAFNTFMDYLRRNYPIDIASRFGDGYCGVSTTLWRVATRELLGQEHAGYPFFF